MTEREQQLCLVAVGLQSAIGFYSGIATGILRDCKCMLPHQREAVESAIKRGEDAIEEWSRVLTEGMTT